MSDCQKTIRVENQCLPLPSGSLGINSGSTYFQHFALFWGGVEKLLKILRDSFLATTNYVTQQK